MPVGTFGLSLREKDKFITGAGDGKILRQLGKYVGEKRVRIAGHGMTSSWWRGNRLIAIGFDFGLSEHTRRKHDIQSFRHVEIQI